MNIIFKHKLGGIVVALILLACQGPWDYWPEDPEKYRGVWIYAHIVSERPVSDVCLEKLLALDETYMPSFAFFDSADIKISGVFSGSSETLTLKQNPKKPNCFDAPANMLAEAGETYGLNASVYWDSSGRKAVSRFTAETKIPERFAVKHALAPMPAISGNPFDDRSVYMQYEKNGRVFYIAPSLEDVARGGDMLSHRFVTDYSADVEGVLVTMVYDSAHVSWGQNFIELMFPQLSADTGRKAKIGDRHRIDYVRNSRLADLNNPMNEIPLINALFPIGENIKFLFYATGREYADYMETDIYSSGDSRVKAKYNIKGGAGIFAGMLVDTFTVNINPPIGGATYDNMYARAYRCGSVSWNDDRVNWEARRECRLYLPEFCDKEYWAEGSIDYSCVPMAVVFALEDGLAWNYHLYRDIVNYEFRYKIPEEDLPKIREEGVRYYCLSNNYPNNPNCNCTREKQAALESQYGNPSMEALWTWCEDREWAIDMYEQCGTAMVSWARINNKKSNVLEREIDKWCAAKTNDPQCAFRN